MPEVDELGRLERKYGGVRILTVVAALVVIGTALYGLSGPGDMTGRLLDLALLAASLVSLVVLLRLRSRLGRAITALHQSSGSLYARSPEGE